MLGGAAALIITPMPHMCQLAGYQPSLIEFCMRGSSEWICDTVATTATASLVASGVWSMGE